MRSVQVRNNYKNHIYNLLLLNDGSINSELFLNSIQLTEQDQYIEDQLKIIEEMVSAYYEHQVFQNNIKSCVPGKFYSSENLHYYRA